METLMKFKAGDYIVSKAPLYSEKILDDWYNHDQDIPTGSFGVVVRHVADKDYDLLFEDVLAPTCGESRFRLATEDEIKLHFSPLMEALK